MTELNLSSLKDGDFDDSRHQPVLLSPIWVRGGDDREPPRWHLLIEMTPQQALQILEAIQSFRDNPPARQETSRQEVPHQLLTTQRTPDSPTDQQNRKADCLWRAQQLGLREERLVEVHPQTLPHSPSDNPDISWEMLVGPDQVGFQSYTTNPKVGRRKVGSGALRRVELYRQLLYTAHEPDAIQALILALFKDHPQAGMEILREGLWADFGDVGRRPQTFHAKDVFSTLLAETPQKFREEILRMSSRTPAGPTR